MGATSLLTKRKERPKSNSTSDGTHNSPPKKRRKHSKDKETISMKSKESVDEVIPKSIVPPSESIEIREETDGSTVNVLASFLKQIPTVNPYDNPVKIKKEPNLTNNNINKSNNAMIDLLSSDSESDMS